MSEPIRSQYTAIARFRNSQNLDYDPRIREVIEANRAAFEGFVKSLDSKLKELNVPDSPELTLAIRYLEQAKDALGRALIHGMGKVQGKPFEEAVQASLQK